MKVLKRNQIIVSVLALMLITVGYMTYSSNLGNTVETGALMNTETMAGIGDAKLVNSSSTVENSESSVNDTKENNNTENSYSEKNENVATETVEDAEIVENENAEKNAKLETAESGISDNSNIASKTVSADTYNSDYFVASRLERDKMYSQMLESYQSLAENTAVSPEQKSISTQEIANINNKKNSIMIAENLIKNLGYEDVVIFSNTGSTSVVIKTDKLEDSEIAQIQNIVCRELGVEVGDIHISLK